MERLSRILRQHEKKLLSLENVVGVGLGYKIIQDKITNKPAILVLVKKKIPNEKLLGRNCVPKVLNDIPTDVIEVGEVRLLDVRIEKARPARPGMSIGHYKITAGTFGALVRDVKTGKPLILSNNHVLANATDGNDGKSAIGDAILQPGAHDGGTSYDIIARLERFVPIYKNSSESTCPIARSVEKFINGLLKVIKPDYEIKFTKKISSRNLVDAAVARPVKEEYVSPDIVDLGRITGIQEPRIGMTVQKSGRTTGLTSSEIKAMNVVINVVLGPGEQATFYDQILTGPMAQPGDSGSIVVDENMKAVGLLFAGSDQATLINPITNVMKLLQIEIP